MIPIARTRSRHALRTLLWGLFALGVLQILLGVAVDLGPAEVRDPDYAAKQRLLLARQAETPDRPLVLVLGTSRTLVGLKAAALHPSTPQGPSALVFNFGLMGSGPVRQRLCLDRLLAAGARPNLLVIEVLPLFLNQPGPHPLEEAWLEGPRLPASEVAACWPYHSRPVDLLRQWARSRGLLAQGLTPELQAFLGLGLPSARRTDGGLGALDGFGWHAHHLPGLTAEERRAHFEFARQQYHPALGELRLAGGPARALRDLLDRCRREQLPAALLLMPESSAFRALYPPSTRRGLDAFLGELARAEHLPLIDARAWADDADFWDGHHLLPQGAASFSARLEREALRPLLQNLPVR